MAETSKYSIAFKGLGLGLHEFEYEVKDDFFEYFDGGIADEGKVSVKITLEKESSLMILRFYVDGTVKVQCDRCLEYYEQRVISENKVFVRYGEDADSDGDVIFLSPADSHIDVGKLIYDFIMLSIPLRRIHADDENGRSLCDSEMLRQLAKLSSAEQQEQTDSRWDNLKTLLKNE